MPWPAGKGCGAEAAADVTKAVPARPGGTFRPPWRFGGIETKEIFHGEFAGQGIRRTEPGNHGRDRTSRPNSAGCARTSPASTSSSRGSARIPTAPPARPPTSASSSFAWKGVAALDGLRENAPRSRGSARGACPREARHLTRGAGGGGLLLRSSLPPLRRLRAGLSHHGPDIGRGARCHAAGETPRGHPYMIAGVFFLFALVFLLVAAYVAAAQRPRADRSGPLVFGRGFYSGRDPRDRLGRLGGQRVVRRSSNVRSRELSRIAVTTGLALLPTLLRAGPARRR